MSHWNKSIAKIPALNSSLCLHLVIVLNNLFRCNDPLMNVSKKVFSNNLFFRITIMCDLLQVTILLFILLPLPLNHHVHTKPILQWIIHIVGIDTCFNIIMALMGGIILLSMAFGSSLFAINICLLHLYVDHIKEIIFSVNYGSILYDKVIRTFAYLCQDIKNI